MIEELMAWLAIEGGKEDNCWEDYDSEEEDEV